MRSAARVLSIASRSISPLAARNGQGVKHSVDASWSAIAVTGSKALERRMYERRSSFANGYELLNFSQTDICTPVCRVCQCRALPPVAKSAIDSTMQKASRNRSLEASDIRYGRCERIRTFDPLHPMQVRYQAAPHTDYDEIITL